MGILVHRDAHQPVRDERSDGPVEQGGAEGWEAFATIKSTGTNFVVLLKKAY